MKKFLAFAAVAGMAALVSCGGGDDNHAADSTRKADSAAHVADSIKKADSTRMAEEAKAAAEKAKADSAAAAAAHADSVAKGLIKEPKK